MKKRRLSGLIIIFVLFLTLLIVQQSQAALGESTDSVESDRKALRAVQSATKTSTAYTVHEIRTETLTVREYLSSAGIVFGIVWKGLSHPDLTPLLGNYASEHKKALSQIKRQPGRRNARIKTDNIVVEKWGYMRSMQGRAYAPALIPKGVSVDEIK